MTTITLDGPVELAEQQNVGGDRVVDVLAVAVYEARHAGTVTAEAHAIVALLANQPSPAAVLALRPSPALQARTSALLARTKTERLTADDAAELGRSLLLEHLVRMAKAHALQQQIPTTREAQCHH